MTLLAVTYLFAGTTSWRKAGGWLRALALAALLPLLAAAQPRPALHTPAAYYAADQARFRPGAGVLPWPAGLPPAGARQLRPGAVVFGWLPAWVPMAYARQVDFALVSHVAYSSYRATEQGQLQAPAADSAGRLVRLVHRANPRARVLLNVGYQEPAAGASLLEAAGEPGRQALALAVAQQVSQAGADGVHLAFAFRARPAVAAQPQPASKTELASAEKRLKKTRKDLSARTKDLLDKHKLLQHTRDDFAQRKKSGQPIASAQLDSYQSLQQQQQADSSQIGQDLNRLQKEEAALKSHTILPAAAATSADGRPAALRGLLAALRQALRPTATLTLELPAIDSARVYAGLLALAPLPVDKYVVQPFDYTAGQPDYSPEQPDTPSPLAPLQPGAAPGALALSTSVDYYLQQKLRPEQLLVGLPSLGKLWARYTPEAKGGPVPPRYQYLTSRSLAMQPTKSGQLYGAGSSLLLELDSLRGMTPRAPYRAWADDSTTLAVRHAWLTSRGLGGVSVWALGFDAPDAPLWAYVRAHLAVPAAPTPATVAPADTMAATAADTTAPAPAPQAAGPWTLTTSLTEAETWVRGSELAHMVLLALAVLLAGTWVGMLVGAVRSARYWVPFARRLGWMLGLLLGVGLLLALYVSWVGHFQRSSVWVAWLAALGLLLSLWLAYRRARPAYPLP